MVLQCPSYVVRSTKYPRTIQRYPDLYFGTSVRYPSSMHERIVHSVHAGRRREERKKKEKKEMRAPSLDDTKGSKPQRYKSPMANFAGFDKVMEPFEFVLGSSCFQPGYAATPSYLSGWLICQPTATDMLSSWSVASQPIPLMRTRTSLLPESPVARAHGSAAPLSSGII